ERRNRAFMPHAATNGCIVAERAFRKIVANLYHAPGKIDRVLGIRDEHVEDQRWRAGARNKAFWRNAGFVDILLSGHVDPSIRTWTPSEYRQPSYKDSPDVFRGLTCGAFSDRVKVSACQCILPRQMPGRNKREPVGNGP